MNKLLSLLLATGLWVSSAHAAEPDMGQARQLLSSYFAALKSHDLRILNQLLDDNTKVEVLWLDVEPHQKFTLSKAEYLQQIKATWHFASKESYDIGPVNWRSDAAAGLAVATLRTTENRTLFDTASGQRNDLEVSVAQVQGGLKITRIKAKTSMW